MYYMDWSILYRVCGVLGLIFIILGIFLKKKKEEDIAFVVGGILLTIYSIFLKDVLFIVLQIVFTLSSLYDYFKRKTHKTYVKD